MPRPARASSPPGRTSAARRARSTAQRSAAPSARRSRRRQVVTRRNSRIAACESGGDPRAIGGGGAYRGKYQFSYSTWAAVGGSGDPAAAPEAEQDRRAAMLYARSGPGQWPRLRQACQRADGAAGHDVVPAVVPAHPGLVAAVVVRRPQDERGLVLADLAALVRLGVEAAPHAHEGVLLPLVPDRRGVGVAGPYDGLGRSSISTSMIECLRSAKFVEPGARTPPTEPLKSVSPVNTSPPTTKLSIPSVWPGV